MNVYKTESIEQNLIHTKMTRFDLPTDKESIYGKDLEIGGSIYYYKWNPNSTAKMFSFIIHKREIIIINNNFSLAKMFEKITLFNYYVLSIVFLWLRSWRLWQRMFAELWSSMEKTIESAEWTDGWFHIAFVICIITFSLARNIIIYFCSVLRLFCGFHSYFVVIISS